MKELLILFLLFTFTFAFNTTNATTYTRSKNHSCTVQKIIDKDISLSFYKKKTYPYPKSQIVALLLALFLGFFGIHRFYLGYTTIGIIQLIMGVFGFMTAGIIIGIPILILLFIWVFIDLIRIATGDLKPADGSEYNPSL